MAENAHTGQFELQEDQEGSERPEPSYGVRGGAVSKYLGLLGRR